MAEKTLWEKEKLLVTSNFSFSYGVFKRLVLQTRKDQGLLGKRSIYTNVFLQLTTAQSVITSSGVFCMLGRWPLCTLMNKLKLNIFQLGNDIGWWQTLITERWRVPCKIRLHVCAVWSWSTLFAKQMVETAGILFKSYLSTILILESRKILRTPNSESSWADDCQGQVPKVFMGKLCKLTLA